MARGLWGRAVRTLPIFLCLGGVAARADGVWVDQVGQATASLRRTAPTTAGENVNLLSVGEDALASVKQAGLGNWIIGSVAGTRNEASVLQTGVQNGIGLFQDGTGNRIALEQAGSSNQMTISQAGDRLGVSATQTGSNNVLSLQQTGMGSTIVAVQSGVANQMGAVQSGTGNRLVAMQR